MNLVSILILNYIYIASYVAVKNSIKGSHIKLNISIRYMIGNFKCVLNFNALNIRELYSALLLYTCMKYVYIYIYIYIYTL